MSGMIACLRRISKWTRPSLRLCRCLCLAVTLLSLTRHVQPASADCVDYSTFPVITSSLDVGARRLQTLGSDHLVGFQESDLVVFGITDPSAPSLVAAVYVGGEYPVDLAICGSIAYCLDYVGIVHAVDMADPTQPVALGITDLGGPVTGIGGESDLLGVVAPDTTWSLLEVVDPLAPNVLYSERCDFIISDIDVTAGMAIVRGNGWQAYDVADPAAPNADHCRGVSMERHVRSAYLQLGHQGARVRTARPRPTPVPRSVAGYRGVAVVVHHR